MTVNGTGPSSEWHTAETPENDLDGEYDCKHTVQHNALFRAAQAGPRWLGRSVFMVFEGFSTSNGACFMKLCESFVSNQLFRANQQSCDFSKLH